MSILDLAVVIFHRLSALVLSVVLLGGNLAACAGWAATPEARMACCADGDNCLMHNGGSHSSGEKRVISQEQANACCAASEPHQSSSVPSVITIMSNAVLGVGIVVPVPVPALVATDAWRTVAPIPIAPVPRHILLSVFLV